MEQLKINIYNQREITNKISEFTYVDAVAGYDQLKTSSLDMNYNNQQEQKDDFLKDNCKTNRSTYDALMSFLSTYIDDTSHEKDTSVVTQEKITKEPYVAYKFGFSKDHIQNTFKDDLTLQMQIKEKSAAITSLNNQLKIEKETAAKNLNLQQKKLDSVLDTQKNKYQRIIKRHQKFMEQLISEKSILTEKCFSLAKKIKEIEAMAEKNLKACTERHRIELKHIKERYAASEKIKRERWIKEKTHKIKEMTIKGLEPELRTMIDQHQRDIQETRIACMKELQDMELFMKHRTNEQLEQLRCELTTSHEEILSNEKNILWTRYKEKLEQQETLFSMEKNKFLEQLKQGKLTFKEELTKRDIERDTIMQQAHLHMQRKIDILNQQHQIEKLALQEYLKTGLIKYLENLKQCQNIKLEETEKKIREESQLERDRQIELSIEQLEKEVQKTKAVLQQEYENKLRCIEEKYDLELRIANDAEKMCKKELLSAREELVNAQTQLQETKNKLEECTNNLKNSNQFIDKLHNEKNSAEKIIKETQVERKLLEDKIALLRDELTKYKVNDEILMSQVYNRIKLILTQKVLIIRNLTDELHQVQIKCSQLEKLLSQESHVT